MKALALPLALLCVLPIGTAISGEIYRWVDASGVTHFSQDAPSGTPYQRVTPLAAPATAAPHVESLRKAQRSAETAEAESNKTREEGLRLKAETLERCAKARERITFLQEKTARRLFKTGSDGQPARYTDEEFEAELGRAKDMAQQNCS